MNRIIAQLSLIALALGLSILVMIYGWGLQPKSWVWIVGGGVFVKLIVEIMGYLSKGKSN